MIMRMMSMWSDDKRWEKVLPVDSTWNTWTLSSSSLARTGPITVIIIIIMPHLFDVFLIDLQVGYSLPKQKETGGGSREGKKKAKQPIRRITMNSQNRSMHRHRTDRYCARQPRPRFS